MSQSNPASQPHTTFGRLLHHFEENFIVICLGLMTLITFVNVVARKMFNSSILWALEVTVYLFAWLVILGASYGVKMHFHIGVDVVINMLPKGMRKVFALIAVLSCLTFSILMCIGAWQYWLPFIDPEQQSFLEVDDVPMLPFLQFLSDWLNAGEPYEKIPRFIPYFALPLGLVLLVYRFLEQAWYILHNQVDTLVAGHQAEEPEGLKQELHTTDNPEQITASTDKNEGRTS